MDAVLLDTDVFSYLLRPNDPRGDAYRPHVAGKTIAISFVTVGELYYGAEKRRFEARTLAALEERIKAAVIVPYDQELCREYARIRNSMPAGRVVGSNDVWIAACAIRHSMPLISNNRQHFEGIPRLQLVTEAKAKSKPTSTAPSRSEDR